MEARRPGPCYSCIYGIRIGQRIRLNDDPRDVGYENRWEHVTCPAAPSVCGECFTEVARNGSCMCGGD